MKQAEYEALERRIKAHFDAGELQGAATVALEGYGPEILGMLYTLMRDDQAAGEAFSTFTEDLWSGLPGFRWGSSFRTWAFRIAHNARSRYYRNPRRGKDVPLSDCGAVSQLAARVRSETLMHLRSSIKDRMSALRARLSVEEQTLLILRVDKGLSWTDVALIVLEEDEPGDAALRKKAAALRQQFHKLKSTLRDMARQEGLIATSKK